MDYKTTSDKHENSPVTGLIRGVKNGDHSAFGALAEMYRALVDSRAAAYAHSASLPGEYDDLRQEAIIALYAAALAFNDEQSGVKFGLFAKICINNRLSTKIKKIKQHIDRLAPPADICKETDIDCVCEFGSTNDEPSAMLIEFENLSQIKAVVKENLSDYELKIYNMYILGAPAGEIASVLGRDEKSIENAVYRIRKKLKKLL